MTTLLDNLMDSLAVERAAKAFKDAQKPAELIAAWWEHADQFEDGTRARRLMQVEYQKRLTQLTGMGAA